MGLVRSVAGARVCRDACEAGDGKDIARDSASRRVACRGESFLAKLFLSTNMDLPSELACAAGDGSSRGKLACACTRGEARDGARIASRGALCVARPRGATGAAAGGRTIVVVLFTAFFSVDTVLSIGDELLTQF